MLVCQCRGITDRQIRRLVRQGAGSTRDVVRATGAGRDCGGCRSDVKKAVQLAIQDVAQRDFQASRSTTLLDKTLSLSSSLRVTLPIES